MGNCSEIPRKINSRHSLNRNIDRQDVLIFHIKTWNHRKSINLSEMENAEQRNIQIGLSDGEAMEINLKSNGDSKGKETNILEKYLLKCLIYKQKSYYKIQFIQNQSETNIWKFVKNWTQIQYNDLFRVGASNYKLLRLYLDNSRLNELKKDENYIYKCEFCFDPHTQKLENRMIKFCDCGNRAKYGHFKCLESLLFPYDPEMIKNDHLVIKSNVNQQLCVQCKVNFQLTKQYSNIIDIFVSKFVKDKFDVALFEVTCDHDQKSSIKYVMMNLNKKDSIKIGRSKKADYADFVDRFISKLHAELKLADGKLYIKDYDSFHGTFIKIGNELVLADKMNETEEIVYRNMLVSTIIKSFDNHAKDKSKRPQGSFLL